MRRPLFTLVTSLAASSVFAAAALLGACSGDDGGASPGDEQEAGSSGTSGTSGTSGSSGVVKDDAGNVVRADSGCIMKSVGPKSGTVATSLARSGAAGGIAWQTPDNARTTDQAFAKITLAGDEESELLRITGFGFTVPEKANILGAVVQLRRQAPTSGIVDGLLELTFSGGRVSGRPKYIASAWPRVIVGLHHYGAPEDRWGNDIFPVDVMSPDFGVEIWAKRQADAGTEPVDGLVDSLLITVYYCDE